MWATFFNFSKTWFDQDSQSPIHGHSSLHTVQQKPVFAGSVRLTLCTEAGLPRQWSASITQWEVAETEGKHRSGQESLVGGGTHCLRHNAEHDIRGIHPSFQPEFSVIN